MGRPARHAELKWIQSQGGVVVLLHTYLNKKTGDVLIPTVAKTEAGYWLEIEPVERAPFDDPSTILNAIRKSAALPEKTVPTPSRSKFPKPVVLSYSNAKSWSAFMKGQRSFVLEQTIGGQYRIDRLRKSPNDSGFEPDPNAVKMLAPGTSLEEAIVELVSLMQNAAE